MKKGEIQMKKYNAKDITFLQYKKLDGESSIEIAPFKGTTYTNLGLYEFTQYYDLLGEGLNALKDAKGKNMEEALLLWSWVTNVRLESNIETDKSLSLLKAILLCSNINDLNFKVNKYQKKKKFKLSEIVEIYKVILQNPKMFGFNISYSDSENKVNFVK